VLQERTNHVAPKSRFYDELEDHIDAEDAELTLRAVIAWGRYAEVFAYDDDSGTFSLEIRPDRSSRRAGIRPARQESTSCLATTRRPLRLLLFHGVNSPEQVVEPARRRYPEKAFTGWSDLLKMPCGMPIGSRMRSPAVATKSCRRAANEAPLDM